MSVHLVGSRMQICALASIGVSIEYQRREMVKAQRSVTITARDESPYSGSAAHGENRKGSAYLQAANTSRCFMKPRGIA